jgi:hypothetical protein
VLGDTASLKLPWLAKGGQGNSVAYIDRERSDWRHQRQLNAVDRGFVHRYQGASRALLRSRATTLPVLTPFLGYGPDLTAARIFVQAS